MIEILQTVIMPSGFATLLFLLALVLLLLRRRQKIAVVLLIASGSIFTAFSSGTVASFLLSPLEYRYPYLKNPSAYPQVNKIVVLTAYATEDALMPLSSYVNSSSAYRLLEANHLYRACAQCEIIVSGYDAAAVIMKTLLTELAVPAEKIQVDGNSPHTVNSALNLSSLLGNKPFFLVTSAGHMPRAMGVFIKQGMQPIPAPTDFSLPKDPLEASITPSPLHLYFSNLAINEYVGLAWYYLTGKI